MAVVLLLALIWAVLLVPPALRAHAARQDAFLLSIGSTPDLGPPPRSSVRSLPVQRRRRIAGGLLISMAVTLALGLLPPFRILLVAHLFLADSFIAYIALLAHRANRTARAPEPVAETVPAAEPPAAAEPARRRRWSRDAVPAPSVVPNLAPLA